MKKDENRRKVKTFHMAIGCDLIGSKTSMAASKNVELWLTRGGIECFSKGSNRTIFVPFANIKGVELYSETEED